jgi:spermidine/putrescine transport system substrate-binding protein
MNFLNHILSPQGQGTLATSECYWAMPANSLAVLSDDQRKILRWDEQAAFMERSVPSTISQPDIDAAMLDIWTEFLQS